MLRIRLRRTGAKKQPRYRVVVAESTAPRDGAYVEVLGWYNPQAEPTQVVVNTEKAAEWIARGAQPSDRVAYLLRKAGQGSHAESETAETSEPEEKPARRRSSPRSKTTPTTTADASNASEAPEAAGSADSVTQTSTEAVSTEAPESEGSAGAASA